MGSCNASAALPAVLNAKPAAPRTGRRANYASNPDIAAVSLPNGPSAIRDGDTKVDESNNQVLLGALPQLQQLTAVVSEGEKQQPAECGSRGQPVTREACLDGQQPPAAGSAASSYAFPLCHSRAAWVRAPAL